MIHHSHKTKQALSEKLGNAYHIKNWHKHGPAYHATLIKDKQKLFLKLATTQEENQHLLNSYHFLTQIHQLDPPFSLPHVHNFDRLTQDHRYLITTYLPGKPLAEIKENLSHFTVDKPEDHFPAIAKAILWLQDQDIHLPMDKSYLKEERHTKMIKKMIDWSHNQTPRLSDLLKMALENPINDVTVTAHGDCNITNFIINRNHLGLVDTDRATANAPQYYDLAECYHRLYTRVCAPELARQFLKTTVNILKENQYNPTTFVNQLTAILPSRAVGNYWESLQQDKNVDQRIKYATEFCHHVADQKFLNIN